MDLRKTTALCGVAMLLAGGSVFSSEKAEISDADREFFEKKIRPIFVEHCYECHDSNGKKLKGGLALNHPSGIKNGGDSGPKIATGDPETSLLIETVRYKDRDLQMPPKSPLPEQAVKDLEKWIAMGAPDPRHDDPSSLAAHTGIDIEERGKHWSFQPIVDPEVPVTNLSEKGTTGLSENPIDAFIFRKLQEANLSPAPPTDKRTWLRRATYDLVGLPPTTEEIDAFLQDNSPEAYAKVVDRLLASDGYGVRWGRHWLDVARYSDSNGLDENLTFGHAWRYRDYVIASMNEDKPFNQFLIEQIAGDLLPEAGHEQKIATGFLALGARVLAEPDKEKLDMDVIDEQLDTTGKAFMGLTLGCARCHDHKFDPILQADYYSLAAFFKSSQSFAETKTGAIHHWFEHDLATEKEKEDLKVWDKKIADAKKKAAEVKTKETVRLRGEARIKAVDYLIAATRFDGMTSLETISEVAESLNLHPRILHHCRKHLEYHRDDAVFGPWWKFAEADDLDGIRSFYEVRFAKSFIAFEEAKKKDPKAAKIEDPELEPFRAALFDNSGFLALPAKPEHAFDDEILKKYHQLEEEARLVESHAPDVPAAIGVGEAKEIVPELPIHIRGSHLNLGDPVPRAFPVVFRPKKNTFPEKSSGRLELAQWMASPDHPLTARVIVNRVWRWHFGTGLVSSTENFGLLGDTPSHPELLDWLASRFVEGGWKLKDLHRLIMSSQTYQMASTTPSEEALIKDPENRLLSSFPTLRLEAEQIRDAVLVVAGRLDEEIGGKTIPLRNRQMVFNHTSKDHTDYLSRRRAAYLPIVRNHVYDWLHLFDYPDPTMPTGNRNSTVIAPQALLMMNSPLALDSSKAFAARLRDEAGPDPVARIRLAWQLAFGRKAEDTEISAARRFLSSFDPEEKSPEAWAAFCQGLYASSEFIHLN